MFSIAFLWTLLALSITGSPVEVRNSSITIPMTSRLIFSNDTNLVQRDAKGASVLLENAKMYFSIPVSVGSPPTYYWLIVDTGSANTWVGGITPYNPTDTSFNTYMGMKATYKSLTFVGTLFTDTLSFGDGLTIEKMQIGVASSGSPELQGIHYDGILGIGPRVLSVGTLLHAQSKELPTVTDRLFRQGSISKPLVGLYFVPSKLNEDDRGALVFGEIDTSVFHTGNIEYTSVTNAWPASDHWGINQRITYGTTEILGLTAGIVDSGTTFIYIASDAYDKYKTETGAVLDPTTGCLSITLEQFDALRPLNFHIDDQTYTLTANAQIWPRSLNSKIEGVEGGIYLVIKNLDTPTGGEDDFCLGYVFLQRFYSVFDTRARRAGFATTAFTQATSN